MPWGWKTLRWTAAGYLPYANPKATWGASVQRLKYLLRIINSKGERTHSLLYLQSKPPSGSASVLGKHSTCLN